jgi:S-formylglutathione hydrolase FrmB
VKKYYFSLLALILFLINAGNLFSAETRGTVIQSLNFKSGILDTLVNYSIYLPANYDNSEKDYPVLYLLHGYTDDETIWVRWGWADIAADQGILSGEVKEMIIVMPDAGLTWYVNQQNGQYNYEDMFMKELIPYIERLYRVKKGKKYRAIGGLSMGGYGALGYSMRHPDMFSSCIAYSAGLIPDDELLGYSQHEYDTYFWPLYGKGVRGKDRLSDHWNKNNPLNLARSADVEKLKTIHWYITCGDDDDLLNGNTVLNKIFSDRKIPHEFRVYDGGHNWNYWRRYLGEGLRFISRYW